MKEGLIIGKAAPGKSGAQNIAPILEKEEFGLGMTPNSTGPTGPIGPWWEPYPTPCRGGGGAAMEFEEDIIL